jgi:peptide subunit release factor 1 (eRF1)
VGNAHHEHAKEVIERLTQIVREDKVSHIILAGDQVVIPLLQEQLPQEMVSMVEVRKLDLHASEQDVLTATLARLQEQEARTAGEKVDRLMQQYRARGLAVVGLQETLEALANGQVEELLISGGIEEAHPQPEEVQAILAPEIPDSEGGTKSEEPRQASVPDLLVTKAKQTGATVTFVEDRSLLESIGGVGAFLRFLRLFGVASSLDVPNRGELSLGERLLAPPQFRNGEWLVRAQSPNPCGVGPCPAFSRK